MKESKIVRFLSYVLIPIIVGVMILSFLSNYVQNYEDIYTNEKEYFATDDFVARYMSILSNFSNQLIFQNEAYPVCYDGDVQISYLSDSYSRGHVEIEDCYVLVRYQNKAITNVELTSETNTIEKILKVIDQNENAQKATILEGTIQADSDVLMNKAIKYFNYFDTRYYTVNETTNLSDTDTVELEDEILEEETFETQTPIRQYITVGIQDFQIYSSYQEALKKNADELVIREFLDHYTDLGANLSLILPTGLAVLILLGVYLIISIGHTKGKQEIDLNDFDKIPYEFIFVIFFLGIGVVSLIFGITGETFFVQDNKDLFVSGILTMYVVSYVVCAIIFDTTVKRIKAKTLIKNTLCYQFCRWCWHILKRFQNKIKQMWEELTQSVGVVNKLLVVVLVYLVVAVMLAGIFQVFGVLLDLGLAVFIFYQIVRRINCFIKIEEYLKQMYEGNNTTKLDSAEFTSEFQNTVMYINDISNGFENAIQEGMKSERLKTELITNVSHDIKTPLTSIINYVDLLKKEEIENEKAKEYMEVLDTKSQRLKKLTEDLLEASKASSGNVKLHLEKINITELIKQATGEFEDKFQAKGLQIIMNMPEKKGIFIQADNRYMYRIIENIFSNVSKYSLENSRVYIDVVEKEGKVQIDVKNISKDVLNISEEELMQRFVRGDKARTTEGSGLGISIAKSLAELQKGEMTLKIDGDLFKVELRFDKI